MRNHFGTEGQLHPLLQVCSVIFTLRAGKLDGNKVKAEDVFRLVAGLLDRLFSDSKVEVWTQQDIDDLWYEQLQMLLDWPDTSANDRQRIVDTEFRIVRKLICHHWDTYYSEWLYILFSTIIDRESKDGSLEEQQRIQKRLSDFSDSLNDWINNGYNGHLSEEIEAVVKGQTAKARKLAEEIKNSKEELNFFAPKKNLQELLKGAWFAEVRTDEKYDSMWTDGFIEALMASEYGEGIARDWAVKGAREKKNLLKSHIVGLLKDAGVLKGSYDAIATKVALTDKPRTFSRSMAEGKHQPYAEWVKEYVAK